MVAGGTGITPMYQIAAHVAGQPGDAMEMSLLFANREPQDVMLRAELDKLSHDHSRFAVTYAVDEAEAAAASAPWSGFTGLVSAEMLSEAFDRLSTRPDLVCTCGPPGFQQRVRSILTEDLNFPVD